MPFWKGDGVGRPSELGEAIGAVRARWAVDRDRAERSQRDYDLDERAAAQPARVPARAAAGDAAWSHPTARSSSSASATRSATGGSACSPRSAAASTPPGALALSARIRDELGLESRRDLVRRRDHLPPPRRRRAAGAPSWCCSSPTRSRTSSSRELGASALFGARFRENAARALLIPRARPGQAHAAVAAAAEGAVAARGRARYGEFPIDPRDLPRVPAGRARPARRSTSCCAKLHRREISLVEVETPTASPFASSLLFDYVATYMYEGDTPNAERRAAALSLDRELLRELLGQEELRDLIDPGALERVEDELQRLSERAARPTATRSTTCCAGSATCAAARRGARRRRARRRRDARRAARERRAIARADRRRGALDRRRGRRPLPRRARRACRRAASPRRSSRTCPTR